MHFQSRQIFHLIILMLFFEIGSSVAAQTVSFIPWTNLPVNRMAPHFIMGRNVRELESPPQQGEIVYDLNFWLGTGSFDTSVPGTIMIDWSSVEEEDKELGSFSIARTGTMWIGTWWESQTERIAPQTALTGPAVAGWMIVEIEDEEGRIFQMDFGVVSAYEGVRSLGWRNQNYVSDFHTYGTDEPKTWYLKSIKLIGVQPGYFPIDGIELFRLDIAVD